MTVEQWRHPVNGHGVTFEDINFDDLLKQFRAHYASGRKAGVDSLRQPYNMLILKVLSLLQDSDPALARTISASREAIWSILADPEKFNSLT